MALIFESHAHYEDEAFNEDREALLASLPENGIEYVVNVGSSIDTSRRSMELAKKYPFICAAIGIHPESVDDFSKENIEWLREKALADKKVVSIGEIGLDYYWTKDTKAIQKEAFEAQIELAKEVKLPIIVHSRDAAMDTYELMKSCRASECSGVVHCFSYPVEEAKKYLDMGFYIGLGGAVTFKNSLKAKEVAAYVPLDRLLLETDCPYMAPVPFRGKRNSSLYIPEIAKVIADLKGIDYEAVVEATNRNAKRMYKICI